MAEPTTLQGHALTKDAVEEAFFPFDKALALPPVTARAKCLQCADFMISFLNLGGHLIPEAKKVTAPSIERALKEFIPDHLSHTDAVRNGRLVYEATVKWIVRYMYEWRIDRWPVRILSKFDHSMIPALMRAAIEDNLPV
jgi:hypothetical protein